MQGVSGVNREMAGEGRRVCKSDAATRAAYAERSVLQSASWQGPPAVVALLWQGLPPLPQRGGDLAPTRGSHCPGRGVATTLAGLKLRGTNDRRILLLSGLPIVTLREVQVSLPRMTRCRTTLYVRTVKELESCPNR
jgi:hypothetical protein